MLKFFEGKKTYIVAAALGLLTALHAAGAIGDSFYNMVLPLLSAGGLASIRSALKK